MGAVSTNNQLLLIAHFRLPERFYFPQQIQLSSTVEPRETYRVVQDGSTVIGWHLEALLGQYFDYAYYPFDHKTIQKLVQQLEEQKEVFYRIPYYAKS